MILTIIIILILSTIFLITTFISFKLAFYNNEKTQSDAYHMPSNEQYNPHREKATKLVENLLDESYERVYTKSFDGLSLSARYYHNKSGVPLVIQFHGYRSHSIRDFSGGYTIVDGLGYNILIVDQRAHGKSEGKYLTMGIKERFDCLSWVKYAVERFGEDTKIILSGVSMGAATVLLASELDLPDNVRGIFADCPYSSPEKIVKKVIADMKLPPFLYFFVKMGAKIWGKFDLGAASPEEAVKNNTLPLLIIHGDDDRFVPYYMSVDIFNAAKTKHKKFITVKTAGHGLSFMVDFKTYSNAVKEFTNQIIN